MTVPREIEKQEITSKQIFAHAKCYLHVRGDITLDCDKKSLT